jgi:hypothetical protein
MPYVVKAALDPDARVKSYAFDEKTMWRGKNISAGEEIFIFSSDHMGGRGLCAKGVVTEARRGPGIRVSIKVRHVAKGKKALGREELKPYRERSDSRPETKIARKLYRQATNKIAGISDRAAAFLGKHF